MNRDAPLEQTIPWWVGLMAFSALAVLMLAFSVILSLIAAISSAGPALVNGLATPLGLALQVLAVSTLFSVTALSIPRLVRVPVRKWIRLTPASPAAVALSCIGVLGLGFLVDEVTFVLHSLGPALFSADGLNLFNQLFLVASPAPFLFLTLAVTLGPGIGEELLFRGLLLRSFASDMPPWAALLFSSLFFGFIHLNLLQGTGAGLIGLYLGFVVLRTGSILPAMAAHALNNFVCALFARYGGEMGTIWDQGHPMWVLAAAGLLFAGALFGIWKLTAKIPDSPFQSSNS